MRYSDFRSDSFFVFHDTKTGSREVPFFNELRCFYDAVASRPHAPTDLIFCERYRSNGSIRYDFLNAIRLAGVEQWPRLFNNLRSSCITDYDSQGYSQRVLDSVFGNSCEVRRRHYVQFRRDLEFDRLLSNSEILPLPVISNQRFFAFE
jgi:hypothetical protein